MRLVLTLLASVISLSAHAKPKTTKNPNLIANYSQLMKLKPLERARYLRDLQVAFAEFERNPDVQEMRKKTGSLAPQSTDLIAMLKLMPEAAAADGGTYGVPAYQYTKTAAAYGYYRFTCPTGFSWSKDVGTCVADGSEKSFSGDVAKARQSMPCGDNQTRVGVDDWGTVNTSYCVSNDALDHMNTKRKAELMDGSAWPSGVDQSADISTGKMPGGALDNAIKTAYGKEATAPVKVAENIKAAEQVTEKVAAARIEDQLAKNGTIDYPTKETASLQAVEDQCSAFRCNSISTDKAQMNKWRKEWKAAGHSECTIGGMASKYRNGEVKAGNCETITKLQTKSGITLTCQKGETMCNPAIYCNPQGKDQESVLCVSMKTAKQAVQATCRDMHQEKWGKDDDATTSCIDRKLFTGIEDVYDKTVADYQNLCFSSESAFRGMFCHECDMLSLRIQNANRRAYKEGCLVSMNREGATPAAAEANPGATYEQESEPTTGQ